MIDDSLSELTVEQRRLARLLQELPRWDRKQLLETLPSVLTAHEEVGKRIRALQQRLQRDAQAATERERIARLRTDPNPDIDDVALAILRGDLTAAHDALVTLGKTKGPFERTANSVKRALQELMNGGVTGIRYLEPAVARLQGANHEASNALRGAFLMRLGRLYRDEVQSLHMAGCAFSEAADLLRDHPEPEVERAELARRRGLVERAHEMLTSATELFPHRAGGWIGLALLAQGRGARQEAKACAQRAADILAEDADPSSALQHVQPTHCTSVHIALARTLKTSEKSGMAESLLRRAMQLETDYTLLAETYQERARLSENAGADDLFRAGRCFVAAGEIGQGVECLEGALEIEPDLSAAAFHLADALFRASQDVSDKAKRISRLHRALALANRELGEGIPQADSVWALLSRAHIVEFLVEHQALPRAALWQALLDCEHAFVLDPSNVSYAASAARLHRKLGLLLTARATIKQGMAIDPANPSLLESLILVLTTENELDKASESLEAYPECPWRTAVIAFVDGRRRTSPESIRNAAARLDTALRAITPVHRGWIYNSIGDCFVALNELAAARDHYELALEFSHRINDQVKALFWLGRWRDVIALGEPQLHEVSNDTPLIASHVAMAHLALGHIELARANFSVLTAIVRDKRALGYVETIELDLPKVVTLDAAATALVGEVVARLRLDARPERRGARRELETFLSTGATGMARQAVLLARSRIAIAEEDLTGAVECVSAMEDAQQKTDALDRLWARCAATAARMGDSLVVRQVFTESQGAARHVSAYLRTGGQTARLLALQPTLWEQPSIGSWIEQHLGLVAPPPERALPHVSLSLPTASTAAPPFVAVVSELIQERYGVHYPGIRVHSCPTSEPCRLWVGDQLVASLHLDFESQRSAARPPEGTVELEHLLGEVPRGVPWSPTLDVHPSVYVGAWLFEHLVDHLSDLMGIREMVWLIEKWAYSDKRGRAIARNTGHLLRLWRLARGLLRERVSLKQWTVVADTADTGRGLSLAAIVNVARRRLRGSIMDEVERRGGVMVNLLPEVERGIIASVRHDGSRSYFASPMEELPSIIAALGDLAQDPVAVVRVVDPEARAWVQRLISLAGSSALVATHAELAKDDSYEDP